MTVVSEAKYVLLIPNLHLSCTANVANDAPLKV